MANCITRSIPNTLTCLNLFSGCIACIMAFEANYNLALLFIILSAVFDFFDGMMARALDAHSIIGKDLDSLADDVSFGVGPFPDCIFLVQGNGLFGRNGKLGRRFPLSRISFVRILCTAACQVQQRYPPDELFRRTSRPGKRLVLGFIGDGRSRLAGEQQFPSGLSVAAGLPFLMAACIGDSNVLTQIQESVMERQ